MHAQSIHTEHTTETLHLTESHGLLDNHLLFQNPGHSGPHWTPLVSLPTSVWIHAWCLHILGSRPLSTGMGSSSKQFHKLIGWSPPIKMLIPLHQEHLGQPCMPYTLVHVWCVGSLIYHMHDNVCHWLRARQWLWVPGGWKQFLYMHVDAWPSLRSVTINQ